MSDTFAIVFPSVMTVVGAIAGYGATLWGESRRDSRADAAAEREALRKREAEAREFELDTLSRVSELLDEHLTETVELQRLRPFGPQPAYWAQLHKTRGLWREADRAAPRILDDAAREAAVEASRLTGAYGAADGGDAESAAGVATDAVVKAQGLIGARIRELHERPPVTNP